jgi:hypothetical protein
MRTERSGKRRETHTETTEEVLAEASNLRKASDKFSGNSMMLQRFSKGRKKLVELGFVKKKIS